MDTSDTETTILSNLINQSQNCFDENLNKKINYFDDLTKLNKRLNNLNEQVCFIIFV